MDLKNIRNLKILDRQDKRVYNEIINSDLQTELEPIGWNVILTPTMNLNKVIKKLTYSYTIYLKTYKLKHLLLKHSLLNGLIIILSNITIQVTIKRYYIN